MTSEWFNTFKDRNIKKAVLVICIIQNNVEKRSIYRCYF